MPLQLQVNADIPKDGEITFYQNGLITKDGDASPAAFGANLQRVATSIVAYSKAAKQAGKPLLVLTGYHGSDGDGQAPGAFTHLFDVGEIKTTQLYFQMFEKLVDSNDGAIKLVLMTQEISDIEILQHVTRGFVFFSWCHADERVKAAIARANTVSAQQQQP